MDFVRPVQAVIPGAQGRILSVLVETTAELNLRTIARLSGVSVAQASRVLPHLVELGIVERREAPPSALFRFVPDHVAARAVVSLTEARRSALDELKRAAAAMRPRPLSIVAFGSFARGEADAASDMDVVIVRPDDVAEEDGAWRRGVDRWREHARLITGNRVEHLEVGAHEVGPLLRGRRPLWRAIQQDGIVIFGASLDDLKARVAESGGVR